MCSPTMFLVAMGMQAGGQIAGGQQEKRMAYWQASQLEADAAAEEASAAVRADKIRKAGGFTQSEARVGYAGAGVRIDSGTPAVVDEEIGKNVEEDALNELFYGKRLAASLRGQAAGLRTAGKAAATNALIGAGGSILSGAAQYGYMNRVGTQPAVESRTLRIK